MPPPSGKPIEPKPAPGPIEIALATKLVSERGAIKAALLSAATKNIPPWTLDGVTVTLLQAPFVDAKGLLTLYLSANGPGFAAIPVTNAKGVPIQPYLFANPPVKVPNGTVRIETGPGGDVEVANFAEDVVAALQRMVVDAILTSKAGW